MNLVATPRAKLMTKGIFLWGDGCGDLTALLDPKSIAAAHPLWAKDMAELGPWNPIEQGEFRSWCSVRYSDQTVLVIGECTTTMDAVWSLLHDSRLQEWDSLIAVSQTMGRGQLRRKWVSPPGNVYASLVLPHPNLGWFDLLPLFVGWCFSLALEDLGFHIQLKWPNDFLLFDRKVAGMLLEERDGHFVLGVGLNLAVAPVLATFRQDFVVPAGILCTEGIVLGPLSIWLSLVNAVRKSYINLLDVIDPSSFPSLIMERLAWIGRRVLVVDGGEIVYSGKIIGFSDRGGLLIDRDGKTEVLFSGSVIPI